MTNVNLQKLNSFNYDKMFLNDQKVKSATNYNKNLQNRIAAFGDLINNCFPRIINFYNDLFQNVQDIRDYTYELGLLQDILHEYRHNWKNGVPILSTMSSQLEHKKIDKETFEFLLKILEHQEEMTKELLNKKLTKKRIETVFNHLRDVSYYLKADLEIESLPNHESVNTVITTRSHEEGWKIIKSDYDPDDKDIA